VRDLGVNHGFLLADLETPREGPLLVGNVGDMKGPSGYWLLVVDVGGIQASGEWWLIMGDMRGLFVRPVECGFNIPSFFRNFCASLRLSRVNRIRPRGGSLYTVRSSKSTSLPFQYLM